MPFCFMVSQSGVYTIIIFSLIINMKFIGLHVKNACYIKQRVKRERVVDVGASTAPINAVFLSILSASCSWVSALSFR